MQKGVFFDEGSLLNLKTTPRNYGFLKTNYIAGLVMMWSIYFYLKQLFRHYIIFFLLVRILVLGHLLGYSSMNYLGVLNIFISFEAIKLAIIGAVKLDS